MTILVDNEPERWRAGLGEWMPVLATELRMRAVPSPMAGAEMWHPTCGKAVYFLNATPDRVGWFTRSHRCGPGDGWQG